MPRPRQRRSATSAPSILQAPAGGTTGPARAAAGGRWSRELVQHDRPAPRSSFHGGCRRRRVARATCRHSFWWDGDNCARSLTANKRSPGLRKFFALGGILLVRRRGVPDDRRRRRRGRARSAAPHREQIARAPLTRARSRRGGPRPFKSYYRSSAGGGRRPAHARRDRARQPDAGHLLLHDIGGALARGATGAWENPSSPAPIGSASAPSRLRGPTSRCKYSAAITGRPGTRALPDAPPRRSAHPRGVGRLGGTPSSASTRRTCGPAPWPPSLRGVLVLLSLGVLVAHELRAGASARPRHRPSPVSSP